MQRKLSFGKLKLVFRDIEPWPFMLELFSNVSASNVDVIISESFNVYLFLCFYTFIFFRLGLRWTMWFLLKLWQAFFLARFHPCATTVFSVLCPSQPNPERTVLPDSDCRESYFLISVLYLALL